MPKYHTEASEPRPGRRAAMRAIKKGPRLVSVIIATYNRADVLARAVDSALVQVHRPLEVVVVDDGSTDTTAAVVDHYDDRIVAVRQANTERGTARNAGLAASSGELIVFLDSDDEMFPNHVSGLAEALDRHPEAGVAYSEAEFFDDTSGEVFDIFPREPVEGDGFLRSARHNFMAVGSVMVRRALLDEIGGFDPDRQLSGSEDWELWTRCLARSRVVFVPGPTVRIHFHSRNTVSNLVAMERALRCASGKILNNPAHRVRLRSTRVRIRAELFSLLAHHYMLAGDIKGARARLIEGLRESPGVVKEWSWLSMAVKAVVGKKVVARLRLIRRRLHLRQRATTRGS